MAKAELKTKKTTASVAEFLKTVKDEQTRKDCQVVSKLMKAATGKAPKMWGTAIVGFGEYRYVYASGRTGDWPIMGFSPRKQNLTLYLMTGFDAMKPLLKKLGKHSLGKSCLYIKRLADVDAKVLAQMIELSAKGPACDCGEC